MNEQEIDAWYDERKDLLMERYLLALEKGANREAERDKYSKAFKRLHAQYEKQMRESMTLQQWREKMNSTEKSWKGVVGFFR